MTILADRDIRQRDIINPQKLKTTQATVIGVGAIGRQVAIQLASIGVGQISLIDFDSVGVENLAPQGFLPDDIGGAKVEIVGALLKRINPEINVVEMVQKFDPFSFSCGVLFCCVDSIDVRKQIFDKTKGKFDLFIDGRMSAEYMRILTCVANQDEHMHYYATQLFPQSEAYRGSCTAKSTIYCANIAAGIMVSQLSKWMRNIPLAYEINYNLISNDFTNLE